MTTSILAYALRACTRLLHTPYVQLCRLLLAMSAVPPHAVVETRLLNDGRRLYVMAYQGEGQIDQVMGLIDEELSEPYTIYTYRYFLNQWPSLCFIAYVTQHDDTTQAFDESKGQHAALTPIGVVIGKLDRHLKGKRHVRGYIGMISVRSSLRGQGIAKTLLHVVLSQMVVQGAQEIVLETEIDNKASLRLYEGFGFIREKRLFNFYLNGKDCFRLIMEIPQTFVRQTPAPNNRYTGLPPPPHHHTLRSTDIL